jgi:hypothetical protein
MPTFNNDFESSRKEDPYDEMFEQAEMMASKRTSDSYSHIKKRSELDTI